MELQISNSCHWCDRVNLGADLAAGMENLAEFVVSIRSLNASTELIVKKMNFFRILRLHWKYFK